MIDVGSFLSQQQWPVKTAAFKPWFSLLQAQKSTTELSHYPKQQCSTLERTACMHGILFFSIWMSLLGNRLEPTHSTYTMYCLGMNCVLFLDKMKGIKGDFVPCFRDARKYSARIMTPMTESQRSPKRFSFIPRALGLFI